MSGGPRIHKDRTRKGWLRRASSPAGVQQRQEFRELLTPKDSKGFHFIRPGSRNPRKVTRG